MLAVCALGILLEASRADRAYCGPASLRIGSAAVHYPLPAYMCYPVLHGQRTWRLRAYAGLAHMRQRRSHPVLAALGLASA
jgi:hypothetical protein